MTHADILTATRHFFIIWDDPQTQVKNPQTQVKYRVVPRLFSDHSLRFPDHTDSPINQSVVCWCRPRKCWRHRCRPTWLPPMQL